MATVSLTKEQEAFLEECRIEFSDRYTDADLEFSNVCDAGIPPPPIMHPWYGRPKLNSNRRNYGNQSGHREHRYENSYGDRNQYRDNDERRHYEHRRYRPY